MIIVTADEMKAFDRQTIDGIGVPGAVLMEAAGRAVAERARTLGGSVVVYAGPGNNGGDGFVAARHLYNWTIPVEVVLCAARDKVKGDALIHLVACERSGVPIVDRASFEPVVIVDALFGTGLDREVSGAMAEIIERINRHPGKKIAVDIPSGLHADRGVPLGVCVKADYTLTLAFAKRGLVTSPGFTYCGRLEVADIGIPERLAHNVKARLLDDSALEPMVRAPDVLSHKGTNGHLLIVAGSVGKSGAGLLCGLSALRGGAGLVTLAAPSELGPVVEGKILELMTSFYADAHALEKAIEGKRALAAGPGMPTDPSMRPILRALCSRGVPVVLDADALNHLAEDAAILEAHPPAILTPHPGEAARLLKRSTSDINHDRIGAAEELAAKYQAVAVLKGARTVIAAPDRLAICPTGNPALGTGGTGDVLTGLCGALLARGASPFEAACAAVYAHGAAADACAASRGSLLAHELLEFLPKRHVSLEPP
jgi:NAD(P)H-hydrate epimerase